MSSKIIIRRLLLTAIAGVWYSHLIPHTVPYRGLSIPYRTVSPYFFFFQYRTVPGRDGTVRYGTDTAYRWSLVHTRPPFVQFLPMRHLSSGMSSFSIFRNFSTTVQSTSSHIGFIYFDYPRFLQAIFVKRDSRFFRKFFKNECLLHFSIRYISISRHPHLPMRPLSLPYQVFYLYTHLIN
jgi:hypothetical protein